MAESVRSMSRLASNDFMKPMKLSPSHFEKMEIISINCLRLRVTDNYLRLRMRAASTIIAAETIQLQPQ
jgi:hypothetical protein